MLRDNIIEQLDLIADVIIEPSELKEVADKILALIRSEMPKKEDFTDFEPNSARDRKRGRNEVIDEVMKILEGK